MIGYGLEFEVAVGGLFFLEVSFYQAAEGFFVMDYCFGSNFQGLERKLGFGFEVVSEEKY